METEHEMRKIIWLHLAAWAAMAPETAAAQVVVVSSSTQEHAAAAGDVVVAAGAQFLRPGQRVKVLAGK